MKHVLALVGCFLATSALVRGSTVAPGVYERAGHELYIGVEHELPDRAQNEFFDPQTRRVGPLAESGNLFRRTAMHEERRVVNAAEGRLGVSLYYSDEVPRATIILVHGNDPETRQMGFIIPYFVGNGVNVISYDQRGTGESLGSWQLNGPAQRAQDVVAIYDAFRSNRLVDPRRIGIWGFSNGGWTAPIVAVRRPTAFMILKSAPAESLLSNIDYEVVQEMQRHGMDAEKIQQALAAWHAFEAALAGTRPWSDVALAYANAKKQSWFAYSLLLDIPLPPSAEMRAGLLKFITYDPAETLQRVVTPTLAVYGELDHNVDVADSSALLRQYFAKSGMRDFTMRIYPHAGHQLILSRTGYNGDPIPPARYVPGYPQIMLTWLAQRGFTKAGAQ
jgi:pimeloyl-ACP methyl ester carboxylesterase